MNFKMRQGVSSTQAARIRRFDRFYERRIEAENRAARIEELTTAEMRVFEVLGETAHSRPAAWLQWRTETVLTRDAKENVLEDLRVRCLRRRQRRSVRGSGPRDAGGSGRG